jgi:two-component system response regulator BaeR
MVVEDEPVVATLLEQALRAEGFVVEVHHDGLAVVERVRAAEPAALLLDLVLPGKDGFSLCREIRAFSTVPMIMITARVDEIDRLLGLDLGADDYVCKPFQPREVVARVRALLRRAGDWQAPAASQGLSLDAERFEARWNGQLLELTPVEFRLLAALAQRPGRLYSRAQLLDAIYVDDRVVSDRTVDSHIKNLRRKFGAVLAEHDPIEAVYGLGYKFVMP